ncbi:MULTISPECIES: Spx/MgsR family RNA polymerase-binding regulatory protein [unclassified Enterococcus]|uniref:Spx/MgsR family RNA polymerase-binding regulatory protein n=1 Tax=unclassified Enterococcus TaxID=2608891 RepID=UPI0013EBDF7B|nr:MULTISPECIES: Spx/MgsR family RNA polymerase-binding regulatory protein [unclassified Enterococcus]
MKVKVYGSAHCVSSLKAKRWLEKQKMPYQFVDLEQKELSAKEAEELCSFEEVQAEQLFATWSEGFHKIQVDLTSIDKYQLILLCQKYKELLRRPLIIIDDVLFIGYNEQLMEQLILNN